jgi:hypothetical protein
MKESVILALDSYNKIIEWIKYMHDLTGIVKAMLKAGEYDNL